MSDHAEDVKDPVAPVEESSTSEETQDVAAEQGDASPGESAPPKDEDESPAQKRIRQLTWKQREAERRAEEAERKAQELEARLNQPKGDSELKVPLESEFDSDSDYRAAMDRYFSERTKAEMSRYQGEQTEAQKRAAQQTALNGYREKVAAYAADNPNFIEDIQRAEYKITEAIQEALVSSDKPAELTHYLAKNPDHALKIAQMGPVAAARELAKVEYKLETASRKVSNAPPPTKDVDDADGGSEVVIRDGMTTEEFLAARAAQRGGRYR